MHARPRPSHARAAALILLLGLAPQAANLQPGGATPPAPAALGQADPVVSWGLAEVADWTTAPVFLDLARTMRPFFGFGAEWETVSNADLRARGLLDRDGYPTAIPPGATGLRTGWDWPQPFGGPARAGRYILTHAGRGTIRLSGAAVLRSATPGRIVFDNPTGGAVWIDITAIAPGDHPRAFSVLRADHVALARAGAVFDPDWLALIADARELRFMDWQRTNAPRHPRWSDRPRLSDATYADRGIPVELMIRLANEIGADPWFNLPHDAPPSDIRAFARLVRAGLDPRLKAHVEYSNETWNTALPQSDALRDRAVRDWGPAIRDDWSARIDHQVMRATEAALIWQQVFGPADRDRLVLVLGTQPGNAWLTARQLAAPEWRRRAPQTFIPPAQVFDEIATTTYFGAAIMADPSLRAALLAQPDTPAGSREDWLFDRLTRDGALPDGLPALTAQWRAQRDIAHAAGLRLVAYEGGQHIHHSFALPDLPEPQARALQTLLSRFVRSERMARLYARLWQAWRETGDGPFMQYTEMSAPSRWGSWGILAFPGDRTPRADLILSHQRRGGSWWGEGGGPQYLQGRTARGTAAADRMDGTAEEDFLAGQGGDDRFAESGGRDGIDGGTGTDLFRLSGPRAPYDIRREGIGHRVTGPQGSTFLTGVERLIFADGTQLALPS